MIFSPISGNLFISDNEGWGNYNREIVHSILDNIELDFSAALGITPYSSCRCLIDHWDDAPEIQKLSDSHLIYLSSKEDYWCQWTYQFSHEYCHHLINGEMTGEIFGLKWFEETICELSSMYHLYGIYRTWLQSPSLLLHHYAPSVLDYLRVLLGKNPELYASTLRPGFLCSWLPILEQPQYHRDYYNALATRMFPLFFESPHLWRIILHIGDSRQWHSLEKLFVHLRQNADDGYSRSLANLENLLLS